MRDKQITPKLALTIFAKIAKVVDFMHQKGFAHLDIKPENILMGS